MIISHVININFVTIKFYCLTAFSKYEVGILMISETKPKVNFALAGFSKPYESTGITKKAVFYFT